MLENKVKRTIKNHSMLSAGRRVLVCLSGGADSVCLLEILCSLKDDFNITLSVCHLNHMLRGRESLRDAEFARELARCKELSFFTASKNARLRAARRGISIEEAARELRYDFFMETAKKTLSTRIAVGHNLDDQAETVLLNLIRGAGPRGLSGMRPARPAGRKDTAIIRPLIETPRSEIISFLQRGKIPHIEDASNSDPTFLRNRLRLEIIPRIEASFGPGLKERLARTASLMSEFNSYLWLKAGKDSEGVVKGVRAPVEISVDGFKKLQPAAGTFVLQKAFSAALGEDKPLSSAKIRMLRNITEGKAPNRSVALPGGLAAVREYGKVVIRKADNAATAARRTLKIPGKTTVPETGARIETRLISAGERGAGRTAAASLDAGKIRLPAAVRPRKPGDRFSPLGMKGRKKLKDFMIDRKMPAAERKNLLVMVDSEDRPVCLLEPAKGRAHTGEAYKISPATKRILQVRIV